VEDTQNCLGLVTGRDFSRVAKATEEAPALAAAEVKWLEKKDRRG
jgi:hypothetical protein